MPELEIVEALEERMTLKYFLFLQLVLVLSSTAMTSVGPPALLGSVQICLKHSSCTDAEIQDKVMPVVKSLEQNLFNGAELTAEQDFLWTELHTSLATAQSNSFCDLPFIDEISKETAKCCRVTVASELVGFCSYTNLLSSSLVHDSSEIVFTCQEGKATIGRSGENLGTSCQAQSATSHFASASSHMNEPSKSKFSMLDSMLESLRNTLRLEYQDGSSSNTAHQDSGKSDSNSGTSKNESDNGIYVDLRNMNCPSSTSDNLCTQYRCGQGEGSEFCRTEMKCY